MERQMVRVTGEQLQKTSGFVRAEARRAPVEVTYHGRPELVVLSVEDYALLRQNRKLAFTRDDMPGAKIERIANNRMDPRHAGLDDLADDRPVPLPAPRLGLVV
jgi:prevent-host-death family protein